MNKKANALGLGIIAMALLLFIGGLFFEDSNTYNDNLKISIIFYQLAFSC